MRRRDLIRAGNLLDEGDNIWSDILPPPESDNAYSLKISLAEAARREAPVISELVIPLLFRHPLVWTVLAVLSFMTRGLLSFTHGCLQRAYRATTSKHGSP
jgi:hypothetical protein